jgi:hypothetical protein
MEVLRCVGPVVGGIIGWYFFLWLARRRATRG